MSSNNNKNPTTYVTYDTSLDTNTTFVQADPSNFRAVVQRLTGSSSSPSFDAGGQPYTASFKLHERRQGGMRKLDMIKLSNSYYQYHGPINGIVRPKGDMVSPVSTLDGLGLGIGSPSPRSTNDNSMSVMNNEEKERAIIAEKGFYLHPVSPLSSTTKNSHEPQLLPLFPLHSPRNY